MPALQLDVTIESGATFQRAFTCTDSAGADLPGFSSFTARGKLRDNSGVEAATFACTVSGTNQVLAELTATQTAALPASTSFSHKYDIEVEDSTGIVYRIAQGRAIVSAEQTK